uniref:Transmembrane protein 14C n=1 Tax=Panagrellus redivivus TaxID=6233 RepID=A0A7E4VG82_PANRE
MVEVIGFVYAALVAAGGIVGYLKAGSIPSLAAGVGSGLIAGFGAYTGNYHLLFGISLLLAGLMTYRFANSGKFMPAGLVAILSFLMLLRCVVFFIQKSRTH